MLLGSACMAPFIASMPRAYLASPCVSTLSLHRSKVRGCEAHLLSAALVHPAPIGTFCLAPTTPDVHLRCGHVPRTPLDENLIVLFPPPASLPALDPSQRRVGNQYLERCAENGLLHERVLTVRIPPGRHREVLQDATKKFNNFEQ